MKRITTPAWVKTLRQLPVIRDVREFWRNLRRDLPLNVPVLPVNEMLMPGGETWFHVPHGPLAQLLEDLARQEKPVAVCMDRFLNGLPMADFEPFGVLARVDALRSDAQHVSARLVGLQRFQVIERKRTVVGFSARGFIRPDAKTSLEGEFAAIRTVLETLLINEQNLDLNARQTESRDAHKLSYRLMERLPLAREVKLKLLQLDNPHDRLLILQRFLQREGLLLKREGQRAGSSPSMR
jgi:Lon protease-like protein